MSEFNQFTKAFDEAVNNHDVETAANTMAAYLTAHSEATKMPLSESYKITRAWMGYDMGENREASTRNTPEGQQAIAMAKAKLSIPGQG